MFLLFRIGVSGHQSSQWPPANKTIQNGPIRVRTNYPLLQIDSVCFLEISEHFFIKQ